MRRCSVGASSSVDVATGITLSSAPAAVQRCTWPVASEAANVPSSAADGHS